jgi:formylglycine-generating enzyme required for sulfatase activity/ElaB/YqjD/DUF883 family membrane-anchored ribosome-binding protein
LIDGIQTMHDARIVHRDIKPQNILLDKSGRFYLADFGLARDDRLETLTMSEHVLGTPHYMSPEQARALKYRIDHRTDIYSISVVLYELLCLRRAFDGDSQEEVLSKIGSQEPRALRRVSPIVARDLEIICAKGMSKRPSQRYSSAKELAEDLRSFAHHKAISARAPTVAERTRRLIVSHPTTTTASIAAFVALLVGILVSAHQAQSKLYNADRVAFEELASRSNWDGLVSELITRRTRLLELEREGEDNIPTDLRLAMGLFRSRLELFKNQSLTAGRHHIERGMAGHPYPASEQELVSGPSPSESLLGQQVLNDCRRLYWDDPDVMRLADPRYGYPIVFLRLSSDTLERIPEGSKAYAARRTIDPVGGTLGPPENLGELPLEGISVPPGFCRLVVQIPNFGFAEVTRDLIPNINPYSFVIRVNRTGDVKQNMKRIEEGRFTFRTDSPLGCAYVDKFVDLPEFFIDEAETSNREYLGFMQATGHPAPKRWRDIGYREDWTTMPLGEAAKRWLDLPVVGINQLDAIAYAEWAGKRLPTHYELERAQRGPRASFRPEEYAADPKQAGLQNIFGESKTDWRSFAESYQIYLRNALPVRMEGYRQAPEGLFHAYGNVAEYTESPFVEPHEKMLEAVMWCRVYLGGAWDADLRSDSLAAHPYRGIGEAYTTDYIGIRCAKSSTP